MAEEPNDDPITDEMVRAAMQLNVDRGYAEWIDDDTIRLTPAGYAYLAEVEKVTKQ